MMASRTAHTLHKMCPQPQIPGTGHESESESEAQMLCDIQLGVSQLDSADDPIPSHGFLYHSIPYDEAITCCRNSQTVPRRLPLFLELPVSGRPRLHDHDYK
jgi:hypothetical protein